MRGLKGLAAAAMLMASCASAQISLSAAVDLALRNDPKVKAAQADVDKARAALAEANAAYIPSVSVAGGYGAATGVPLNLPVVFSLSSQSLLFNFSQRDNLRAANAAVESAKLALEEMREKVSEDVVETYLDLDNAQQRDAVKKQAYGYATRLVRIVNDRYDAGQDTRLQLLEAKHTAAQMNWNQLHEEDEVATLAEHLLFLVGIPGDHIETIPSSIPAMPDLHTAVANESDSAGVRAAEASARSKQEVAFGERRYALRPQIGFGANYSRITTTHTSYTTYYPAFLNKHSDNALSVGIQIQIPLFDRGHDERAHQAAAEASRARFTAEDERNQFLEGRFKLRHSLEELNAGVDVAQTASELSKAQLEAVEAQLTASASDPDRPQMTPKDEQNARLQQSQKEIDLLNAQQQMNQAEVNLLRQTGQLDGWIKTSLALPVSISPTAAKP